MCVEFDFVGLDFVRVQVTILIHVVALPVIGTSLHFEYFGGFLCITVWHIVRWFCFVERGYFVIVDTYSYSHPLEFVFDIESVLSFVSFC